MSEYKGDPRIDTTQGIIVEASLELLTKAAEKVLFEYDEYRYNIDGEEQSFDEPMEPGDYIIFEEKIKNSPAQIVVVTIIRGLWYVISTSEMPPGGYVSGRDAMRAAEAEEKRERIFKEFLKKEKGVTKIEDICEWKPDVLADAQDVLGIINKASRRFVH
jgi:hypothetical protein